MDLSISLNTTAVNIDISLDGRRVLGASGGTHIPCQSGPHTLTWTLSGGQPNTAYSLVLAGATNFTENSALDANGSANGAHQFQV